MFPLKCVSCTLDVYKPVGVIAEKRKHLERSEQGGKYIIATWSQIVNV